MLESLDLLASGALVAIGLLAGLLTTSAGMGGGIVMLLLLAGLRGPHYGLAASSASLLIGNVHRLYLFRRFIDGPVALRCVLGIVPGSALGSLWAVHAPEDWLRLAVTVPTALAIAKELGWLPFSVDRRWLLPGAFVAGLLGGAMGGAAFVLVPLLLALGMPSDRYLGTIAVVTTGMHASRAGTYAWGGLLSPEVVAVAGILSVSITAGNLLGQRLRRIMSEERRRAATHVVLVACVGLSVWVALGD